MEHRLQPVGAPASADDEHRLKPVLQPRVRGLLSLRKEDHFERLVSIESADSLVKVVQRIKRRLHDPFDIEA
jgi:hypothetical protein